MADQKQQARAREDRYRSQCASRIAQRAGRMRAACNDWRPYIESCIDAFGVNRCMFESNFPVDKAACSYSVLWNAFKRLTSGASAGERAALFHDTAQRFYRL